MNTNIDKAFKKTIRGNYFGYYKGYYISTWKKPHGKWACAIGYKGRWLWSEGLFGTYLDKISKCKWWVKSKINGIVKDTTKTK